MKPHFLNVDLQVKSRRDLSEFTREMDRKAFCLTYHKYRGVFFANYEVKIIPRSAETIMKAFCRILENLSPAAAAAWRHASSKVFDFGFQSGDEYHEPANPFRPYTLDLSPETLTRMAKLKAGIRITLYPLDREDSPSH
jgi:hypothetical protein